MTPVTTSPRLWHFLHFQHLSEARSTAVRRETGRAIYSIHTNQLTWGCPEVHSFQVIPSLSLARTKQNYNIASSYPPRADEASPLPKIPPPLHKETRSFALKTRDPHPWEPVDQIAPCFPYFSQGRSPAVP